MIIKKNFTKISLAVSLLISVQIFGMKIKEKTKMECCCFCSTFNFLCCNCYKYLCCNCFKCCNFFKKDYCITKEKYCKIGIYKLYKMNVSLIKDVHHNILDFKINKNKNGEIIGVYISYSPGFFIKKMSDDIEYYSNIYDFLELVLSLQKSDYMQTHGKNDNTNLEPYYDKVTKGSGLYMYIYIPLKDGETLCICSFFFGTIKYSCIVYNCNKGSEGKYFSFLKDIYDIIEGYKEKGTNISLYFNKSEVENKIDYYNNSDDKTIVCNVPFTFENNQNFILKAMEDESIVFKYENVI